jgi:hypothetical protein
MLCLLYVYSSHCNHDINNENSPDDTVTEMIIYCWQFVLLSIYMALKRRMKECSFLILELKNVASFIIRQ